MKFSLSTVALLFFVELAFTLSLKNHDDPLSEFCWKDSYGRGVGTIPSICPNNKDKIGLLCYDKCPSGYYRFGFDCHQYCPTADGWADQGLFCRLAEYGRGSGYAWWFWDGFSDSGMVQRCEADNGRGNCEKNGLMYYPKCKAGYYNVACCICRPSAPNCNALGYNGGIDLSCAKYVIIGNPKSMDCPVGLQYDAGLCYITCTDGYYGVGPVCWANAPNGWVGCGMGAATTTKVCTETIFDQFASVGNLAVNIVTLGGAKAAAIAKDAAKAAELKKQFEQLKKIAEKSDKVQKAIAAGQGKFPATEAGKSTAEILKADPTTVTPEDMVRVSSQIASLVDPTGVSDVVGAYTYSKCSNLKI
jgi:hypothetical protein